MDPRGSIQRPSSCMSASSELLFFCFFLHSTFSQERRAVLVPSQWRQEQTMTVLTMNGSRSLLSGPQVLARLAPGRGKLSVVLVLTRSNSHSQNSDLQQASTHFDYLHVNGHEIWISELTLTLDLVTHVFASKPAKQLLRMACDLSAKMAKTICMLMDMKYGSLN